MEYVYGDCLIHHGIKGQKWGVRRYQNPDGTLTRAGQKRYNKSSESSSDGAKRMPHQKTKKTLSGPDAAYKIAERAFSGVRLAEGMIRDTGSLVRKAWKDSDKHKVKSENEARRERVSNMSDDELKKVISRLKLEKEYYALVDGSPDKIASVKTKVKSFIDTTSPAVKYTSESVKLYQLLKKRK